jgi:hypothetical protein
MVYASDSVPGHTLDDDGGCYVAIFAGPAAEQRARDYGDALTTGRLPRHNAK